MKVEENKDLTQCNTFGMKVKARCFVEYSSIEELRAALSSSYPKPYLFIGGGSNILFTKDFPGTVFHSTQKYIKHEGSDGDFVNVEVAAGVVFDDFCQWAAENNLWGIENLSHIPGEVGASAVQNVGAYGVEAKDVIVRVNCLSLDHINALQDYSSSTNNQQLLDDGSKVSVHELKKDKGNNVRVQELMKTISFDVNECGYGYRESKFKTDWKSKYVITSVVFRLSKMPKPVLNYGHLADMIPSSSNLTPSLIRKTITEIRKNKLPEPSELGSAGSFFKNPIISEQLFKDKFVKFSPPYYIVNQSDGTKMYKIPAAWMIEQCGWKGVVKGNVSVYEKQPLVIVNQTGKADPEEVISLEQAIIETVKEKFSVELHPEVEHI